MFDLLSRIICSVATFAFPTFASYKALKANDPAQLTPWLIYWVVLSCVLCVESWVGWAVSWLPFYQDIRAGFMLWLVLPQTQGATQLYLEYIHPVLNQHEADIEIFISRVHDQAKAAGAEYVQRLISSARDSIFGIPSKSDKIGDADTAHADNYAQALFNRWRVAPLASGAPQMASEFYNFMSNALAQPAGAPAGTADAAAAPPNTQNLIPNNIKDPAEKAKFIELQRQRLETVLAALEQEKEHIQPGPSF